jgi:hypothetical protein
VRNKPAVEVLTQAAVARLVERVAASEQKQPPARERQQDCRSASMEEHAPPRASQLGVFQQTPAEDQEITDRLLTIESGVSS